MRGYEFPGEEPGEKVEGAAAGGADQVEVCPAQGFDGSDVGARIPGKTEAALVVEVKLAVALVLGLPEPEADVVEPEGAPEEPPAGGPAQVPGETAVLDYCKL